MARAFIALGSNLGHCAAHLDSAREQIDQLPQTRLVACSTGYRTEPVGPPQPAYLNAAVEIETQLDPHDLLQHLLAIEKNHGRVRGEKWGPRTLDLDLLLYDDRMIDSPGLVVPHPRMHERPFVLDPLNEIAPDVVHPRLRRTISQLAHACRETE
jgi:2-amino-4-hydroxy-6-hydroxymethyldihydropteridine diphosphokinase